MKRLTTVTVTFMRWVDHLLAGPPPAPRACQYRRSARITYYRHGERTRSRRAA